LLDSDIFLVVVGEINWPVKQLELLDLIAFSIFFQLLLHTLLFFSFSLIELLALSGFFLLCNGHIRYFLTRLYLQREEDDFSPLGWKTEKKKTVS